MILLDTHTLIWWLLQSSELSKTAVQAIQHSLSKKEYILVSTISIWEISLLYHNGRLPLIHELKIWLSQLQQFPELQFIPIDFNLAHESTCLPGSFHKDPADRFIVATAMHFGATLITKDAKIRRYKHVKTLW